MTDRQSFPYDHLPQTSEFLQSPAIEGVLTMNNPSGEHPCTSESALDLKLVVHAKVQ